jgi:hypothetical protein
LDIKTLLKIEKLLMHLEGKGKSANTLDGVKRHILQITKRATALFFQASNKERSCINS